MRQQKREPSRARRSPDFVPLAEPMLPFWHGHPLSAVTTGFLRNPFPETRAFIQGWRIQPGRGGSGLPVGLHDHLPQSRPSPNEPRESTLLGCETSQSTWERPFRFFSFLDTTRCTHRQVRRLACWPFAIPPGCPRFFSSFLVPASPAPTPLFVFLPFLLNRPLASPFLQSKE